jgi:hypothetical protein
LFKPLALLLALAAAIVTVASLTPAGNAAPAGVTANTQNFPDSVGDVVSPGGDVASMDLSNDDKGYITVLLNVPNRPTLTGDMFFVMFIDADANAATGNPQLLGADYFIELDGPFNGSAAGIGLFRWDGTDFTANGVPQTSLTFSYANGAATIKISAADLGATKRFNFAAIAISDVVLDANGDPDFTNAHYDYAPDQGHGFFAYDVKTVPPALVVQSFSTKPLKPKAGKAYTASLAFGRTDGSPPTGTETVSCRATVAGRALAPTSRSLINGKAACTWTIPKTAKGKAIRVTVTVQSGSLKASKSATAKIS